MLGRVFDALGAPIDGRGALSVHERRRVEVKALVLGVFQWSSSLISIDILYENSAFFNQISSKVM
ncbi:ATP synthase subunit alpha mitochondrial [Phtheirospermum japonicum]|uniref:ATP synthase subunit alpha mitochondrial n=1 Tax=Phtheirospermum japonicum TaxID=374723 RepID=A0A830DNK1_9LAMI|nr:ATP synthase subunit alpha mitochondrial [Phtheirospermum japonicum]